MLAEMPIRIDQPYWLLLLLLIIPTFLFAQKSIGGLSRAKAYATFGLRSLVIAGLTIALAEPNWVRRGEGVTTTILLDRSHSIPVPRKKWALDFLARAVEAKENPEDRVAVLTIGRDANITAMADTYSAVTVGSDEGDPTATNLAAGVRLALATTPPDTANRIVLASDGNETIDSVLAAAELAKANNVPIDVLVLRYEYDNEVVFEQIICPPRAREGQTARVRLVLRSQAEASGTIRLKLNGDYLDLNGDEFGDGMLVALAPGTTALEQTIALDESGPHEFEAVFIPDDPAMDAIDRNNAAVGVTFVSGQGKVLVVDDGITQSQYLVNALQSSGIAVDVRAPDALVGGLVFLSGYDAVVLVNIPRWAFDQEQDRMLHAYVHDLGGGLTMIGGPQSFGAGGWIESEVSRALPILLNPPDMRQMPAGALALVMHSCEMPQGNFWGQKVAQAAIEQLSRLDYVGIIEFGFGQVGGIQGCTWAFEMQRVRDKRAALESTKTMNVGDMPSFGPGLQLALQGLDNTTASQRHVIIISDGDPSPPSGALLQQYKDKKVTVTTVMVGGHGTPVDASRMKMVATTTGGEFYPVKNPKQLPAIFIKEARMVSRSLIQDGDVYQPQIASLLPGPAQGFSTLPPVDGYVLTAVREGLAQTSIVIATTEGNDPLYAHWNYGLGRTVAYTSDLSSLWGSQWASWGRFRSFWEQTIRWSMRPSSPTNMSVSTRFDGDTAIVELEALDADASYLNFVRTRAVVLSPSAEATPLSLQQVGPGRYRGTFPTEEDGAYLVNIGFESGSGETAEKGNLQAAVSVPYPKEFRSFHHNEARLAQLARLTGGRVLNGRGLNENDPMLADIFNRDDLEVPRTMKRMWDLLAIICASLLVLDVAARRISFDPARARERLSKAVGRREEVSMGTVAAWKRTREQVAHRRDPRSDRKKDAPDRDARYEADEEDAARAIDVGAEQVADLREVPKSRRPAQPTTPDADEDDGDYTSRLLAAKRRARGQDADDQGAGDG
ncbi:MAG: VWA domain-containing protein [Planctomycetes bacterium]|nr:VWA domain-containing protein [Planctomycetota bacterium]